MTLFLWQLGTFLNTVKRMLDVLHCSVENILKAWASYLTIADASPVFGEQMNAITILLRKKYKKYMESIIDKLVSNVSKYSSLLILFIIFFHIHVY